MSSAGEFRGRKAPDDSRRSRSSSRSPSPSSPRPHSPRTIHNPPSTASKRHETHTSVIAGKPPNTSPPLSRTPEMPNQELSEEKVSLPGFSTPPSSILSRSGKSGVWQGDQKPQKRLTGKAFKKEVKPKASAERGIEIYDHASRSGLSETLDKQLREETDNKLRSSVPTTSQAQELAEDKTKSLSDASASRNHDVSAETTIQTMSAMAGVATSPTNSPNTRKKARKDMNTFGSTLAGNSPNTSKKIGELITKLTPGKNMTPLDAAETVTKIVKRTADHPDNVGHGDSRKNSSMSNRRDPVVSPGGKHMLTAQNRKTEILKPIAEEYQGAEVASKQIDPHASPGGTIFSSKVVQAPSQKGRGSGNKTTSTGSGESN